MELETTWISSCRRSRRSAFKPILRRFGCREGLWSAEAFQRRWEPLGPTWRASLAGGGNLPQAQLPPFFCPMGLKSAFNRSSIS